MSEQSTEVKGFKNSTLKKFIFKIAAIAGLQDALDGKAAASHTHSSSESWLSTLLAGKANSSHNHVVYQVTGLEAILLNVEARIKRLESAVSSSLPDSAWETIEGLSFDGNQTGYKYTFGGTSDTHDVVPSVGDIVRIKGASHTYSHYGEVTAVDQVPYAITTSINLSGIQSSSAYLQILKDPTAGESTSTPTYTPNSGTDTQDQQELGDVGDIELNPGVEGGGK